MATAVATFTANTGTLTDLPSFNWGPITSLYKAPSTCLSTLTYDSSVGYLYVNHWFQDYFDASCYPPLAVNPTVQDTLTNWGLFYYSPAICPFDWITASTYTSTFNGNGISGFGIDILPLGSDTSAVLCCPTGFATNGINGHQCTSSALPGETILYIAPSQSTRGEMSTVTLTASTIVYCDGIPIWWQSSDVAVLAAAATTTGSSSFSSGSFFSTSSSPSPTSTGPINTSSPILNDTRVSTSGLSLGLKAAIGVLIPSVLLALLAGLVWLFRLRRKSWKIRGMHELQSTALGSNFANNWTELPGYEQKPMEMGVVGHEVYEAPSAASPPPVELSVRVH